MDDPITPNSETDVTPRSAEELARISRWVEGLLDADILLPEEGGALLETIEAARRCQGEGARKAARGHVTRLGRAIEALVRGGRIEPAQGRLALEPVNRLLQAAQE